MRRLPSVPRYSGQPEPEKTERNQCLKTSNLGVSGSNPFGAPALSTHLPCKKYCHFTEFARNRARANFAPNALLHRAAVGALRIADNGVRSL